MLQKTMNLKIPNCSKTAWEERTDRGNSENMGENEREGGNELWRVSESAAAINERLTGGGQNMNGWLIGLIKSGEI